VSRPPAFEDPLQAVAAEHRAAGGLVAGDCPGYSRRQLEATLRAKYSDIDLDYPGLALLHADPPVLAVHGFMRPEECDALVAAAQESGGRRAGCGA
jgi:hypothetical protein